MGILEAHLGKESGVSTGLMHRRKFRSHTQENMKECLQVCQIKARKKLCEVLVNLNLKLGVLLEKHTWQQLA